MLSRIFGRTAAASPDRFSVAHLQNLHAALQQKRSLSKAADAALVIDTLKQISELMVYGDQQSGRTGVNDRYFEVFCERSMLKALVDLFQEANGVAPEVQVQVLQTVSILLMNISNQRSLCECPCAGVRYLLPRAALHLSI